MLKETIKYLDYDGNERTETFYFNFSQSEVAEMEMSVDGGLGKMIQAIVEERDMPRLMALFKDLILKAYGEKSPDGKRFVKSEELSTAFSQTEAYSQFFMKLISDSKAASAFVNGVVPKELLDKAQAQ